MKMLIVGAGVIGIVYGAHIAVPGVVATRPPSDGRLTE
jgi:ketopantoate reductase